MHVHQTCVPTRPVSFSSPELIVNLGVRIRNIYHGEIVPVEFDFLTS